MVERRYLPALVLGAALWCGLFLACIWIVTTRDRNRRSLTGECFRYATTDPFGCARDQSNRSFEREVHEREPNASRMTLRGVCRPD